MRRDSFILLACIALCALSARAQAVHSASAGNKYSLSVGVLASAYQPDNVGNLRADKSPNYLYGYSPYVDLKLSRWIRLEFENHEMVYNSSGSNGVQEESYLGGLNVPLHRFGRLTPYAKVLGGYGIYNTPIYSSKDLALNTFAYGGGVDYKLSKRFVVRTDFEVQRWRMGYTDTSTSTTTDYSFNPYGLSIGLSYKIF